MVEVVGRDPTVLRKLQVTCQSCGNILQYVEGEVQTARYTCMGDDSGHKYVACPCGRQARIPGTSW